MTALAPGTRIRLTDGCPWPERRGCVGVVVGTPPGDERIYPWHGKGRGEVVVLLDDDSMMRAVPLYRGWTCVLGLEAWIAGRK